MPEWPVAWASYRRSDNPSGDFNDLIRHGVRCVSWHADTVADARLALDLAGQTGMRYHIEMADITERADLIAELGFRPEPALLIGGAYLGRAIDRHLFHFGPGRHSVVIEPPVYNPRFAYGIRSSDPDEPGVERIAHYYPDMPPPIRAEVVVPRRAFDGRQHLAIVPADIAVAEPGARPEGDTVTPDLPAAAETRDRRLYRLTFDLSGLGDALLDQVGLAVYWAYGGTDKYWIFGRGHASAWAESTRKALRALTRRTLAVWSEANGGAFPAQAVPFLRFGDECFFITGHLFSPAVSYPLWDFSAPSLAAFRQRAGGLEYPRTWGFPEIYGPEAYAHWLHTLHDGCAALCGVVREGVARQAPGVAVFRNTTRMGIFDFCNEHDGSGQELLTRNLDLVHLDPYPVRGSGYEPEIPRDMSYCAGLARRYRRPLVPWMQAHTYGGGANGLQHVTAAEVRRMSDEQWAQGVDAVVWLGYGARYTFPSTDPAAWEEAAAFHRRLAAAPPSHPAPRLAVLRPYRTRALCSLTDAGIRNPADWLLQQFLEVWAVEMGQPYDVFELAPGEETPTAALLAELARYPWTVATIPWPGAWTIGADTEGQTLALAEAPAIRERFRREIAERGWATPLEGATP
jgi:hypothetical protein